jgi:hypothetical protein
LRAKLEELDEKIKSMRTFRRTLARHYEACEKELRERGKKAECPVLIEITNTASEEGAKGKGKGK